MLYVIYVQYGKEIAITEHLRQLGYSAYCPLQMRDERRKGCWERVQRVMFCGYVFLDLPEDEITPTDWHRVAACSGFLRLLSRYPIAPSEDGYIRLLCSQECIGISRGYVRDGALHITEGFAKRLEHKIIKYNRRGRRATAEVTIYGEKCKVTVAVIFDSPPAAGDTLPDSEKI